MAQDEPRAPAGIDTTVASPARVYQWRPDAGAEGGGFQVPALAGVAVKP